MIARLNPHPAHVRAVFCHLGQGRSTEWQEIADSLRVVVRCDRIQDVYRHLIESLKYVSCEPRFAVTQRAATVVNQIHAEQRDRCDESIAAIQNHINQLALVFLTADVTWCRYELFAPVTTNDINENANAQHSELVAA